MQITDHPAVAMLEQLGGNSFIAMTGAREFVSSDNPQPRLTMRLPANLTEQRGTHMEVSLLPTDEYLMVFFKLRNGVRRIIERVDGVQVSGLRQAFERMTGLRTSL